MVSTFRSDFTLGQMSASANGLKIVLMRKWTPDEGMWQVLHGFNVIHEP